MSDLEKDFGPYAFYIEKLQSKHFDIPEALAGSLYDLAQAGLWNLPDGGKYEAIVKVRSWQGDYEERCISGRGVSPTALKAAFPELDETFVTTAWEKFGNKFEHNLRVSFALLHEPAKYHADIERLGREARAMKSSSDVTQSGIVTEFCAALLNREFALLLSWSFSKDSYWWTWELASYLLPQQESIKYLEGKGRSLRTIQLAIDAEVLKLWGDDDVVANMRHGAEMCKGFEWVNQQHRTSDYRTGDPLCKTCVRIKEVHEASMKLYEELREKGIYTDFSYPSLSFKSVEDIAAYREEVLDHHAKLAERVAAEETASAEESLKDYLEEETDPFVEDVIYLVEGLTKLGVSPNKAAEVASKLMTSSPS